MEKHYKKQRRYKNACSEQEPGASSDLLTRLQSENDALKKDLEDAKAALYRLKFRRTLANTVGILVVVAAAAVLTAMLFVPVMRIYGSSMAPTLQNREIVMALRNGTFETGDVIAFTYNNKLLIKRVIAAEGDWINLEQDGTVYVNGMALDEPYLTEKAYGETDITFPYQVPEGRVFVMGDNRSVSIDSRNTAVGCVSEEQIAGRLLLRIWPLNHIGTISR